MTISDQFILALTAWRENRSGGEPGMTSIINVVMNRAQKHKSTPYAECVKKLQFSSLTAPGDPELVLWPAENDHEWQQAQNLALQAVGNQLLDLTDHATIYYNPKGIAPGQTIQLPNGQTVPFPKHWNKDELTFIKEFAGHLFFVEKN